MKIVAFCFVWIFGPMCPIIKKQLVQIMDWHQTGDRLLSESVRFNLLTYVPLTWEELTDDDDSMPNVVIWPWSACGMAMTRNDMACYRYMFFM